MGIMTIFALALLATAGAVTAIVSCLLCTTFAFVRKREVLQFAVAGMAFGAFIFPWPYVVARIFGRCLPSAAMVVIYFFAYAICIGAAAGFALESMWIWEYTLGTETGYVAPDASIGSAIFATVLLGALTLACGVTMFISARWLYRMYRSDRYDEVHFRNSSIDDTTIPDALNYGYLVPFIIAYSWLVAGLIVAIMVAMYMVSIGVDIQGF